MKRNGKRIEAVKIVRLTDESPDTSHLGEYSNSPAGDYSIDRKHTLECPVNDPNTAANSLQRALDYLFDRRRSVANNSEDTTWTALDDACDILAQAIDDMHACDCDESGNYSRHEYQYFNTSGNYKGLPFEDIRSYTIQDYKRMEALNACDWSYVGIRAVAEIRINGVYQRITSAGLWGIESDSDASYFESVAKDELHELRSMLYELGFSKRAIASACKDVKQDR